MKQATNFLDKAGTRHPDLAAGLGYGLLAMLFYAPLLLGLRTFPDGDFTHHFLPFALFQQQALRSGQWPVWNPYTYSGHPFLADTQAAVFYPLSNLVLGLTMPWTAPGVRLYFLQIEAMLHVALAGCFVYLLVRDLTHKRLAAFLAGCCFAFSGYLTSYPPLQLAVLRTAIWLPLLLWLLWRGFQTPQRWRWWIGAALAYTCAFLAGHPQTFLHISYTVLAWLLFLLAPTLRTGQPAQKRASIMGVLAFGGLTLALSAAQLWPSLEFTQLSVRANVDYAFVSGGFPLQDTWQILLPGVLTQFSPLYIGVIGLGLAVIASGGFGGSDGRWAMGDQRPETSDRRPSAHRPSPILFYLLLTLVALLLAYGAHSFLYPLFYRFAPGWQLFRGQERAAFLVTLGLSILAGYGAALLPELTMRARRRWAVGLSMLVAGGIYAFGLLWQLLGHGALSNGVYLVIALVTFLVTLALIAILSRAGWSQRRLWLLIGLVLANLFWANGTTDLAQFGPTRKTILAPEMAAVAQAVAAQPNQTGLPGRVYNEFRVYEDYGMRQQLEDVWGSSPLRLARYAALFDQFPLDRMWQLTGVQHLLTWRKELFEPGQSTVLAAFPQQNDTTYLQRLQAVNPRAWIVHQAQTVRDEVALQRLADHTFALAENALLAADAPLDKIPLGQPGRDTVHLTRLANNQLHVEVTSEHGGFLIISENWLPGWHVQQVQCSPQKAACILSPFPYRTDLSFLGLPVPAGQSRFDLVYWPDSIRYGLWISAATLLLLSLACLWHWRQRRQGSPT